MIWLIFFGLLLAYLVVSRVVLGLLWVWVRSLEDEC
jgi:hypothetical protein